MRTMVSRYTCGFVKVKIAAMDIVEKRLFDIGTSISIVLLDLNADLKLIIP